ncbi:ABC transporter permease/substrate-binding protein [Pontibacter silvestris]|uniref:ABC transporter permease/substrate-binding protein n=1 Tax=Pontibacter silvestris TaxID=2305183 RepID=A0ABW4WUH8_9BACT|nr:ABC transporter permease/substrate-binding protein [Pontibacter silvestris]MCC9138012.1 ABC transporter permease/substrate-binding protein [Pontibacter silvestris]
MNDLAAFVDFVRLQSGKLLEQTLEHIGLTIISLSLSIVIGLPLGLLITRYKRGSGTVLGIAGILQTIPSIALLGFLIPFLGIGPKPAIFALFLYSLLPIIRNTYTGVMQVDPTLKEAARGMGMTDWQLLTRIELPLALPVLFAGIRTAAVLNVGVATLAAYIAAGGLGEFIFGGIALNNTPMILAGAIPAALLAIAFDFILARLQNLRRGRLKPALLLFCLGIPLFSSFYLIPNNAKLQAGLSPEFAGRPDGYPGLKATYQLDLNTVIMAPALVYKAVYESDVDIIDGYSTDGKIKTYNLRVLEDDKQSFPPYHAAFLVREPVLQQHPELRQVLELLSGTINDSLMTELNYQVDFAKQSPADVAKAYLKKKGLWQASRSGLGETIVLGSKIFTEQYILTEMLSQLIKGYTDLQVSAKTGLGGTKICFDALAAGEIDIYPEYTGTGLQVILNTPPALADSLSKDKELMFKYVSTRFQERFQIEWLPPLGFNNTYALMMREQQAKRLHITTISDLKHYLEQ